MRRMAVAFALGFVTCLVVVWLSPTTDAREGVDHDRASPDIVRDSCPPAPSCVPADDNDGDAASRDNDPEELAEAYDRQLKGLSKAAFGVPLRWEREEAGVAAENMVNDVIANCDSSLEPFAVDCTEPPCLVGFWFPDGKLKPSEISAACPDWNDKLGMRAYRATQKICDGEKIDIAMLVASPEVSYRPFQPDELLGENEVTRHRIRSGDLGSSFECP